MGEKAAMTIEPRETSMRGRSATGEPGDRLGQLHVALGDAAGIVAGQPEIDPVPDAGELRMMIDLLGVQRDSGEKGERLAEVAKLEAANQRLAAVLERP